MLRSASLLLLAVAGPACGTVLPDPFGAEDGSGTTADVAEASTGPGVSASSATTGTPPEVTSSSSTGDSSTTSDDTGMVWIQTPEVGPCVVSDDGYWHCSSCDVAAQDCPEGEKCMPWNNDGGDFWNATRCVPIPGDPAGLGEPCVAEGSPVSGLDDCEQGTMCWEVDPRTLEGTCATLCSYDWQCADGAGCAAGAFEPLVCLSRCDPFDPATCPEGEVCQDVGHDALCVPSIVLPQGLPCGADEQYCAAGQACAWQQDLASCAEIACCTAWCDLSAPDPDLPCAAVPGEVCRSLYPATVPEGYEHVGVCGV